MDEDDILAQIAGGVGAVGRYGGTSSPAYLITKPRLESEQQRLKNELEKHGVSGFKTGLEIEFVLEEMPPSDSPTRTQSGVFHWQQRKDHFLTELDKQIAGASGETRTQLLEERKIVANFNARETLFHELIHDPVVEDLIKPVALHYDPERKAISYYDNIGVLEVKTCTLDGDKLPEAQQKLVLKIEELMSQYDLKKAQDFCYHYNFSFKQGDENMFDPAARSFETHTPYLLQGVGKMMRDCAPAFYTIEQLKQQRLPNISIGPSRMVAIRLVGSGDEGHAEIQLQADERLHNFDFLNMLVMAGALHGMKEKKDAVSLPDTALRHRGFSHYTVPNPGYVTHAFNALTINDQGKTQIFEPYLQGNAEAIGAILGLCAPQRDGKKRSESAKSAIVNRVTNFFKSVQISEDGGQPTIQWPRNQGVSDEKLRWLDESIKLNALVPTITLDPGYLVLAASPRPSERLGERVARMSQSQLLHDSLSPECMEEIRNAVEATFGVPSPNAVNAALRVDMKINAAEYGTNRGK